MLKHYLPHLIFFLVFFAAAAPVLYYLRRKNPDPRFRPGVGEMSVMTLIAVFICGGMAFGLGSLFRPENDGSSLKKKPDMGAGWSAGDSASAEDPKGGRKKSRDKDEADGEEPPRRRLFDRN